MFFWKIKKRFGLWLTKIEVSTLTLTDASGPTVWLTDIGIHKIDGFTFKNEDGWWEHSDSTRSAFPQKWNKDSPDGR